MAEPITLYSYFRSSCSWRVRMALNLKQVPYEIVPINLLRDGGEQHSAGYRALNPQRQVPSLMIDGVTLAESLPIIEYLDETRPVPALLPGDPYLRAVARRIAEGVNAGIQPLQNLRVLTHVETRLLGDKQAWARHWIEVGFNALEAIVSETAQQYCVGDAISVADLFVVPQVYNARRFGIEIAQFPLLSGIDERMSQHPAVRQAHPHRQPDTPADLREP